jgi:hypothetical protein
MASALVFAIPQMKRIIARFNPPCVSAITPSGSVNVYLPHNQLITQIADNLDASAGKAALEGSHAKRLLNYHREHPTMPRFQFSLRALLVVTAVVAIVSGYVGRLSPEGREIIVATLPTVCLLVGFYVIAVFLTRGRL